MCVSACTATCRTGLKCLSIGIELELRSRSAAFMLFAHVRRSSRRVGRLFSFSTRGQTIHTTGGFPMIKYALDALNVHTMKSRPRSSPRSTCAHALGAPVDPPERKCRAKFSKCPACIWGAVHLHNAVSRVHVWHAVNGASKRKVLPAATSAACPPNFAMQIPSISLQSCTTECYQQSLKVMPEAPKRAGLKQFFQGF